MKDFIQQLKPHPVAIEGTLILLAGVIVFPLTVKKNVEFRYRTISFDVSHFYLKALNKLQILYSWCF